MKVNSSEKILSTTDLSNLTYSAGSTCSDYSWVKKKAASKKTPACSCRNKSTWKRTFTGKVAFKTQVQRTGLGIAHNPTRWNYTTQEFPPLVKLTPLPPQALLPRGDPNSTDQRTSGLQPCFELGPPTIREIATNTKPPKRWDHQWHLLFRAEWQRAGRCHLQGSKASRESPPAHKVSAAPNCSWSCHGKTTIPWLQWHCAASKSSHSKPVGYSVAAPPSLLKLLLSQSKN